MDKTNRKWEALLPVKTAEMLVEALKHEGVSTIYGIPGEENLDFLDALRTSGIRLVLVRHEQAAGFMAATAGRLTGEPGVCFSTLGPGAANLVTAAAYAKLGGMPMVMITGQKPIKRSKQGRFQIIDVVDMMRPLVKYTSTVVHGHTITAEVRRAFKIASEEPPGPVHLELPEDIAREETDAELFPKLRAGRAVADQKAAMEAVDRIQKACAPLILIGAGANRRKTHDAIEFFVEKTGIPFFTTQMGKGVLDERSPLFLGTAAMSTADVIHRAAESADMIINIGHDVVEKPPFFMRRGGAEVIHINYFPANVDEVYFPSLEVVGDIAKSVAELAEHIEPQRHWDFGFYMNVKAALDAHTEKFSSGDAFPIQPERLVRAVRDAMPSDGIVALDNGVYKLWFARDYKAHEPNTLLLDNALATMGAGLPSAMAAKLVYPGRSVMAVCGDGGFMMNVQELETAVRLGIGLVVLVLNDSSYGMIRWKQQTMKMEQYGVEFTNPDFVAMAESFGAHGHRLMRTPDLGPMINDCYRQGGVHLIDVPVDYSTNTERFSVELPAFSRQIEGGPQCKI